MLNRPPMIPGNNTPYTLIGDNMRMLVDHYKQYLQCPQGADFDAYMAKKFDPSTRQLVGDMYTVLALHGYYVSGINRDHLIFSTVVDPRPDWAEWQQLEKPRSFSLSQINEMKAECRKNLNSFCALNITVSQNDIDNECPF